MIYSTNLFTGPLPATYGTIFTAPSGFVVVIRDLELLQFSAGNTTVNVATVVSGMTGPLVYSTAFAPNAVLHWEGRVVLPAGSTIQGQCLTPSNQCSISGYQLQ